MSKCPLCGSDGDDLVFRFYCSNDRCQNHVAGDKQWRPEEKLLRCPQPQFTCKRCGRIRHGECRYCHGTANIPNAAWWDEHSGQRSVAGPECRLPRFEVSFPGGRMQAHIAWRECVPQLLKELAKLPASLAPRRGNVRDSVCKTVNEYLTMLAQNGELVWSDELGRWELHSVEY